MKHRPAGRGSHRSWKSPAPERLHLANRIPTAFGLSPWRSTGSPHEYSVAIAGVWAMLLSRLLHHLGVGADVVVAGLSRTVSVQVHLAMSRSVR